MSEMWMQEPILRESNGVTVLDGMTMRVIPTYTCGHCSDVVILNAARRRDRVQCKQCMRFICERKPICREVCTPIHALAADHFEGAAAKRYPYISAILSGASTVDEAEAMKKRS